MSIWSFRCDDGYFAGIMIAQTADEVRKRAWELHGKEDAYVIHDGEITDMLDPDLIGTRRSRYVESPLDYEVVNLGDEYIGSDGRGHIEIGY